MGRHKTKVGVPGSLGRGLVGSLISAPGHVDEQCGDLVIEVALHVHDLRHDALPQILADRAHIKDGWPIMLKDCFCCFSGNSGCPKHWKGDSVIQYKSLSSCSTFLFMSFLLGHAVKGKS